MRYEFLVSALIFLSSVCSAATSAEYIRTHSVEISNMELPGRLLEVFQGKRLVLLGENHGTVEMPKFVGRIVGALKDEGKSVALGLEFPKEIQPQLEQFLKTGDEKILKRLSFFQDADYHSGRGSKAMVALLQAIRGISSVSVFCFDIPFGAPGEDRDTEMARNVWAYLENNPGKQIITFSGNLHSRLVSGIPSNPEYKLMGAEILRLSNGALTLPEVANVNFRYDEGSAWQCLSTNAGKPNCGVHEFDPVGTPYATAVSYQAYFLAEPQLTDGHFNSIFFRRVSASLPL